MIFLLGVFRRPQEVLPMSDNWVVQNLVNALEVWNGKLSEIWQLVTQSP